ncbi:hypothetical protein WMY93_024141 [Mugilogobius chulae]|uniref:Uncharacterized protein n=1 Tax=Mugilogobius chulae TaxID=88201 RepID=A0AAW0NGS0_9GOBI
MGLAGDLPGLRPLSVRWMKLATAAEKFQMEHLWKDEFEVREPANQPFTEVPHLLALSPRRKKVDEFKSGGHDEDIFYYNSKDNLDPNRTEGRIRPDFKHDTSFKRLTTTTTRLCTSPLTSTMAVSLFPW